MTGDLQYTGKKDDPHPRRMEDHDWFCEGVLWTDSWTTRGCMVAKTECELMAIMGEKFREVVTRNHTATFRLLCEYAALYVEHVNDRFVSEAGPISDCDVD